MTPRTHHTPNILTSLPVLLGISCSLLAGCTAVLGIEDFVVVDDAGVGEQPSTEGDAGEDQAAAADGSDVAIPSLDASDADASDAAVDTQEHDVDSTDSTLDVSDVDGSGEDALGEDASEDASDEEASEDATADVPIEAPADAGAQDVSVDAGEDADDASEEPVQDAAEEEPVDAGLDVAPDVQDAPPDATDAGCPVVVTDEATMVLVATYGADVPACGSVGLPCRTVTAAIDRAAVQGKTTVAIAPGQYEEVIDLRAGVTLAGGWQTDPVDPWRMDCSPEANELVVLKSPPIESSGVVAENLGGKATLSVLTIRSRDASQVGPGESTYGVLARGSTTELTLDRVIIETAAGGAGADGAAGGSQEASTTGCEPSDGADGVSGADAPFASPGVFTMAGYEPGEGVSGAWGGAGADGTEGGEGSCVVCISCKNAGMNCKSTDIGESCGGAGQSGCGGLGGEPGEGGGGGGSSVAVYAWDAVVTVWGGSLSSGDGAAGGAGGLGGLGGLGGEGTEGNPGDTCLTSCTPDGKQCVETSDQGSGGLPGGPGGIGGRGGNGSGGTGGNSFAIVAGGLANVGVSTTTELLFGAPGSGADGAMDGKAGVWWP